MRNVSFDRELSKDDYIMSYPPRHKREEHLRLRPFFDNITSDMVGVEIGVFECNNAYHVCHYNKPKLLYLVDPYLKYNDVVGVLGCLNQKDWDNLFQLVHKRMEGFPVEFIRKKSLDAVNDFCDGILDFCYIDGDHRKQSVLDDIAVWLPKVKKGGFIGGHDFDDIEVRSAVLDWISTVKFEFCYGFNDWWVKNEA